MEEKKEFPMEPAGRKRFPVPGDVFAMLGIVFGAQILVGLLLGTVMAIRYGTVAPEFGPAARGGMLALTYFLSMSIALGGILVYRRVRGGAGCPIRFACRGLHPGLLLWGLALIAGVSILLEPVVSLLPGPSYEAMGRGVWTFLALAFLAPVFEETLCRGILLGELREKYGVAAAWAVSSLFFGVMHIYPAQLVGAFVIGLILGFIYIATDSLWAPMILHAANNAVAYLLLATGHAEETLSDLIHARWLYVAVYVVAALLVVVSAWMIHRTLLQLKTSGKNPAEV